MKLVNIIGLILITLGALGAGICSPGPTYNRDGSISLGPSQSAKGAAADKKLRIRKHFMQKYGLPTSLWLVGIGSALQLVVATIDALG
jgi:hypothetical protein